MADRIHPWRASAADWRKDDPNGPLIILPSATTGLSKLGAGQETALEADDIAEYRTLLAEAVVAAQAGRVNTFFQLWSFGIALDIGAMGDWLDAVDDAIADAAPEVQIRWATLPEMVDAYVASSP